MSTLKIEHITNIGRSGEDLSIDTNGNVGIGTTSPSRNFHVKETTTGGTVAKFENTAGTVFIELNTNNQVGADAGYIAYDSNQDLSFWPSDSRAMTLKADGKVGIGTTGPGSPLQVNGTVIVGNTDFGSYDSTHGNLMVSNGASETSILLYNDAGAYNSGLIQYNNNVLKLGLNNSNSANTLLTTSAINVNATGVGIGIGAASPFHINLGTDKNIQYSGGIGEIGSVPGFQATNDASSGLRSMGMRATTLRFATGSDERMRIDENGNVGIGTTSIPSANSAYLTVGTQDYAISHNGFSKNSYFDGSNYTAVTNAAGKLIQMGDDIIFYHSPTVAAGAAQTQTALMVMQGNGNVGVNANANLSAKFTVNKPAATHTTGYQEDIAQLITTETTYLGRHYLNFFHDNNNRDASGHHTVWGMAFGYDNNTRGGIQYDHKGNERMTLWSSYGSMQFKLPNTPVATKRADEITEDPALELKANGNNLRPRQSAICLTLSASQGIPGSGTWAWEKINLNTVIYQNGNTSAWDSGNSRYVCPESGLYLVTTSVQMENNSGAVWRYLFPCINGATSASNGMNFADFVPQSQPNATYYHHTHSCILKCSSGDYIEWKAHGSGGGSTLKSGAETACAIYFLG